ncbi:MAG TPA: hypothetical protein VMZ69_10320 [Saprospiraceae bacterium]|nr:hypothetical protein [Saprospiraceae bacterium]
MNRGQFIRNVGLGAVMIPGVIKYLHQDPKVPLDKTLVQEFVGTAHRDMDRVITMHKETPNLLNASHDWGYGDFETALDAASHVGYKELVTYLVEHGAQTNIFTACLFGQMEIVKPILDRFPKTLHAIGPHGFTLLHHAIRGGEEALEVKTYLESLGAKETKIPLY